VILPAKRSFANAGRIQPGRHRSQREMPCLRQVAPSNHPRHERNPAQ
jgi:hypothetical protein